MNKDVYLTFKTDYETHFLLKEIAHKIGKTQPELINEICQEYIKALMDDLQKMINGHNKENSP